MKRSRFSEEQIIGLLKEHHVQKRNPVGHWLGGVPFSAFASIRYV